METQTRISTHTKAYIFTIQYSKHKHFHSTHIHLNLHTFISFLQPNLINKPKKKKKASAIPKTKKTNEIKINREIEKKTKEEGRVITTATIGGGVGVCHLVVDGWVCGSRSFRVEWKREIEPALHLCSQICVFGEENQHSAAHIHYSTMTSLWADLVFRHLSTPFSL